MSLRVRRQLPALLLVLTVLQPQVAAAKLSAPASGFASVDAYLHRQLGWAHIPGAALGVVHGRHVVHVQGFGSARKGKPVTPATPFVLGSLSKSFTAMAVMQLAQAKKVELDAPVTRYLPWFRLRDPARVTVRQLLNQTSGISTLAGVAPLRAPASTLEAQVRSLSRQKPVSSPGSRFVYSNMNYEVLGLIVQTIARQPFADYVEQHIFAPLGMAHSFVTERAAEAHGLSDGHRLFFGATSSERPFFRADFLPAGFLISSAADMSKYLVAQLDDGRYRQRSVLSRSAVKRMHQPAVAEGGRVGPRAYYGMGWFISPFQGTKAVWHDGSSTDMHSILIMEPSTGWGVVLLYNATSALYELAQNLDAIGWAVLSRLTGQKAPGTLAGLYLGFDVLVVLVVGKLGLRLKREIQRRPVKRRRLALFPWFRQPLLSRLWVMYSQLLMPLLLLLGTPRVLNAPWPSVVRTDIGLAVLLIAVLQITRLIIRLTRAIQRRRATGDAGVERPAWPGRSLHPVE